MKTTFAKFLISTSAFIFIFISFLSSQSHDNTNDSIADHTFFNNQSDYRHRPDPQVSATGGYQKDTGCYEKI